MFVRKITSTRYLSGTFWQRQMRRTFFVYVVLLGLFLLSQLSGSLALANGFTQNAMTKYFCATRDCNSKSTPDAIQLALVACKTKVDSKQCKDFVKNEPEFAFSLKKCDEKSFCEDELAPISAKWWESCGRGFLEGTGHGMNELYEGTVKWWENTGKRISEKNNEIRNCADVACKRNLVRDVPKFQTISDEQLSKWPAAALYTEVENFKYISSTSARQATRTKTIGERAEEAELRKRGLSPESSDSLLSSAWAWLEKKEANLQCLDAATRIEMRCWGAAYIIDPTMVVGAGLKGAKMASYVAKLAKEGTLAKTGARVIATAAEQNSELAAKAVADMNAGKSATEIRQSIGKISDDVDGGKARLDVAAQAMGRKGADDLSASEKNWILAGHNTHADTAYGNIGSQKIRDKMNAGGRRPETISSSDTRKLLEYGIMGNPGQEIYSAATLSGYSQKASSSVGRSVLGKKSTSFYESENRLAGEKLLRYKEEASLKAVVKSEQEAQELALGFFEKDYKYNLDKVTKSTAANWQDYSNLSTAAIRTGRVTDAKKYLDLEVKAFSKDRYQQGVARSLGERLSEEARNNARSPQWLKQNVKKVLEDVIKEKGPSIPPGELRELQRSIQNYLN